MKTFILGALLACSVRMAAQESSPRLEIGMLPESNAVIRNYVLNLPGVPLGALKAVSKSCGCITSIQAPIGKMFARDEAIPLTVTFNTVGKPEQFHTKIVLTFTADDKDAAYLVDVEGTVKQRFAMEPSQTELGIIDLNESVRKIVSLSNYTGQKLELGSVDPRLTCKMTGNQIEIVPATNEVGLYNCSLEVRQGNLTKSYVVMWAVKNPLFDRVALVQGLVEHSVPHDCQLVVRADRSFAVTGLSAESGKLATKMSATASEAGNVESINITYTYRDKGPLTDMLLIATSLPAPNDRMSIPFSAIFY